MKTALKYLMWGALLSIVLVGFYARLWVDDYCQWGDVQAYDPLTATLNIYNGWAGIYTHFYIRHVLFTITPYFVQFIPLTLVVWAWLLARQIAMRYGAKNSLWSFGAVLCAYVVVTHQGVYWAGASMTYSYGALAFATIALLYQRVNVIMLACLAVIACGLSETPAIVAFVAFGVYAVWRKEWRLLVIVGGIGLGVALVMLAPGNAVRANALFVATGYRFSVDQIPFVVTSTIKHFVEILIAPRMLIASIVMFSLSQSLNIPRQTAHQLRLMILFFGMVVCAGIAPSFIVKGFIEERTVIPSQMAILAFWGYCGVYVAQRVTISLKTRLLQNSVIACLCAYVLISNVHFLHDANAYAQSWDKRHAMLLSSEGNVTVSPLDYNWSMDGLGDMANNWVNVCVAHAYQLNSITVK